MADQTAKHSFLGVCLFLGTDYRKQLGPTYVVLQKSRDSNCQNPALVNSNLGRDFSLSASYCLSPLATSNCLYSNCRGGIQVGEWMWLLQMRQNCHIKYFAEKAGERERVERDRRIEIEGLRLKPPQFLCVKK